MSEKNRRFRRHQQVNEQTDESTNTPQKENRKQYSDNELDDPSTDGLDSNVKTRRRSIFGSIKFKKDKVPLPRPSSACGIDQLDEKQHRKSRQSTNGSIRPARVNIFFKTYLKKTIILIL